MSGGGPGGQRGPALEGPTRSRSRSRCGLGMDTWCGVRQQVTRCRTGDRGGGYWSPGERGKSGWPPCRHRADQEQMGRWGQREADTSQGNAAWASA